MSNLGGITIDILQNSHSDIVKGTNKVQEWSNNTSIHSNKEYYQILKMLYNRLVYFDLRQVFFDCLLPDTEFTEDVRQKIIRRNGTCNLTKPVERKSQILSE